MTDALSQRDPILRVVPMPSDINTNGHIFGGWVLSQMDLAGGIVAGRIAEGPVATVAIETMKFIAPILVRDLVSLYATVARRGRTSIAISIDVVAERAGVKDPIPLTSAIFTFVSIDDQARPRPLPPESV